jgi:hypothetical protein
LNSLLQKQAVDRFTFYHLDDGLLTDLPGIDAILEESSLLIERLRLRLLSQWRYLKDNATFRRVRRSNDVFANDKGL